MYYEICPHVWRVIKVLDVVKETFDGWDNNSSQHYFGGVGGWPLSRMREKNKTIKDWKRGLCTNYKNSDIDKLLQYIVVVLQMYSLHMPHMHTSLRVQQVPKKAPTCNKQSIWAIANCYES